MILYAEDWSRYPHATVHLNTPNKSFVELASKYKSLGVKNHAFILALYNPTLEFIDPFSESLTDLEQKLIAFEARDNPWYYFREIARAPAIGGGKVVPMEANRGNIALFWLFFNHVTTFLIQIRQTGKSFSTDTLMTYLMHIACADTTIDLLTKNDSLRRSNIKRLKDIAEELPHYLNQRTKKDASNTEEITVIRKNNVYRSHVPAGSEKGADKVGRGLTSGIFHIDEAPFQPFIKVAVEAALPASGAAMDRAREAGAPHGIIFTTTAGKKDDRDGAYIYKILSEAAVWSEKFFDCINEEDLYRTIRTNSRPKNAQGERIAAGVLRVNITMNHRQLGKTDAWLKDKLENAMQDGDAANRDYFNMWTSGSQSSPLQTYILDGIRRSVVASEFDDIATVGGYITHWYIPQDRIMSRMLEGKFVLGVDSSNASSGDDIAMYLMDVETLETVMVATVNETNLRVFSRFLARTLIAWKNITLVIENRSTGQGIIDDLLIELPAANENPFARIYNTIVNTKNEKPELFERMQSAVRKRDYDEFTRMKASFGFTTSGGSGEGTTARSNLYGLVLQLAAKRVANRIYNKKLADQITALENRNGRVDHPIGGHDDLVVAWLLSHWFVTQAKNLRYYGIDPSCVGALLEFSEDIDPVDLQFAREQRMLRENINRLIDQLSQTSDQYVTARLEQEIRRFTSILVIGEEDAFNPDELIRQAKEKRKTSKIVGGGSGSGIKSPAFGSPEWRNAQARSGANSHRPRPGSVNTRNGYNGMGNRPSNNSW